MEKMQKIVDGLAEMILPHIEEDSKILSLEIVEKFSSLYLHIYYEVSEECQRKNEYWYNVHYVSIRLKKGPDDARPFIIDGGADFDRSNRRIYTFSNTLPSTCPYCRQPLQIKVLDNMKEITFHQCFSCRKTMFKKIKNNSVSLIKLEDIIYKV